MLAGDAVGDIRLRVRIAPEQYAGGSGPEPIVPTSIEDVLSSLPRLGSALVLLFTDPEQFAMNWTRDPQGRPAPAETLPWSLGFVGILYLLYAVAFGASPFDRMFNANVTGAPVSSPLKERSHPRILHLGFVRRSVSQSLDGSTIGQSFSLSLSPLPSLEFPEAHRGLHHAQPVVLQAGVIHVVVDNVVPGALGSKGAQTLLLVLYALITVACLQPAAAILGATTPILETLDFALVLFSFAFLLVAVLSLVFALVLVDVFGITFDRLNLGTLSKRAFLVWFFGGMLWNGLLFGSVARALFMGYATLFGFGFWQMCLASAGGIALSAIVTPILFVPVFLVFLRFKQLFEALA